MKTMTNFDTLLILCGMIYVTLLLFLFQQFSMSLILGVLGLPTVGTYLVMVILCFLLNINRVTSTGIGGCFLIALVYIPVVVVWNRCMFSPNLINLSGISLVALVGVGILYHVVRFYKKVHKHKMHCDQVKDMEDAKIQRNIIRLFFINMLLSIVFITLFQFFSGAPYNPNWDAWDLSGFQWAERLFSMSCTLWVIAASAYFLGLNRSVLTSKRVQATMAAIFLMCGLATTLIFKNVILAYSALAAPLIYLIIQNRMNKADATIEDKPEN